MRLVMGLKKFETFNNFVLSIFLALIFLQFYMFISTQVIMFIGAYESSRIELVSAIKFLFYAINSFLPVLIMYKIGNFVTSETRDWIIKLGVAALRVMLCVTSFAIVFSALFWYLYPYLSRYEPTTFLQIGLFSILYAFDRAIVEKYLTKAEKPTTVHKSNYPKPEIITYI